MFHLLRPLDFVDEKNFSQGGWGDLTREVSNPLNDSLKVTFVSSVTCALCICSNSNVIVVSL